MLRMLLLVAVLTLATPMYGSWSAEAESNIGELYFLYLDTCLSCKDAEKALYSLSSQYPDLRITKIDIADSQNQALIDRLSREYGLHRVLAPTVILNDRVWIGFSEETSTDIENQLDLYFRREPDDEQVDAGETGPSLGQGLLAYASTGNGPVVLMTSVIGFLDGFNPCSLWALTVLLAYTMNFRSRQKLLLVGATFIAVTALVYGLFMASILTAVVYLQYHTAAGTAVNLFLIAFGAINIKDYFSYKKGISFTISDSNRDNLLNKFRSLMKIKNTWLLVVTTVFVAGCTTIVELPCTAGFPVLWSSIMSKRGITGLSFYLLLGLYLSLYVLTEIVVLGVVATTLKIRRISTVAGRKLKLFSGLAMAYFGLAALWLKSSISVLDLLYILLLTTMSYFLVTLSKIDLLASPNRREHGQ